MKKFAGVIAIAAILFGATACGSEELSTTQAAGADRTFEEGWANIERGEVYCIMVSNISSNGTSCKWDTVRSRTGVAEITLHEAWVKTSKGDVLCIKNTDQDMYVLPDCDWSTLKVS